MASSKGAPTPKGQKPKVSRPPPEPASPTGTPRPLPAYRSGEPDLDAVLLPLLARSEPGRERPLDLEHARVRLLEHSKPGDAAHIVALLNDDALDLGAPPSLPRTSTPRSQEQRQEVARSEHARAARLDYLGILFAAACLHASAQKRLAEILTEPHPAQLKERLVLQLTTATLRAPLRKALLNVLDQASPEPSPEERNLMSGVARALQAHLSAEDTLAALQPYLDDKATATPGGIARAQMILTDLDAARLTPAWRPVLGSLLKFQALASFACDLFAGLPASQEDAILAAAALDEQLDQGDPPDGYLLWLLARSPHKGATKTLLRLLDAELDPDWQTILDGIERTGDTSAAEPLLQWIERHRKRSGRPGSWDGFDAARNLARRLAKAR